MSELRFHEMSYAEIGREFAQLQAKYDRVLRDIQIVAQAPSSVLAKGILVYYYPLKEAGRGTSLTLKIEDRGVHDEQG